MWSTVIEADDEETVRKMAAEPGFPVSEETELIEEVDVKDYLVVEMVDEPDT